MHFPVILSDDTNERQILDDLDKDGKDRSFSLLSVTSFDADDFYNEPIKEAETLEPIVNVETPESIAIIETPDLIKSTQM